ncbi:hypothetical protein NDN08_000193 [Rhodosorus marinus]|uniref:Uncharacterized protein n=1 Tax=Rhodosorus marinus TaxID=101924 RepID=A0AAV8UFV9_9RHOD|nr:hypothetical protein NDN08_000193 [Rhodosorus marinus]
MFELGKKKSRTMEEMDIGSTEIVLKKGRGRKGWVEDEEPVGGVKGRYGRGIKSGMIQKYQRPRKRGSARLAYSPLRQYSVKLAGQADERKKKLAMVRIVIENMASQERFSAPSQSTVLESDSVHESEDGTVEIVIPKVEKYPKNQQLALSFPIPDFRATLESLMDLRLTENGL